MMSRWLMKPIQPLFLLVLAVGLGPSAGCRSPLFYGQSPDDEADSAKESVKESDGAELIRQIAVPDGLGYQQVQGVGLVLNLDHTGSSPPPSPLRDELLSEMQTHKVEGPKRYMNSDRTSIVHVRALIPPGAKPGDRIDVEVRVPRGSKTSDLHNGWLMMTRLREQAILGNRIRTGRVLALAQGNIVTDKVFGAKQEDVYKVRGRILGGAQVQSERMLGLRLREEYASPFKTSAAAAAINARFHYSDGGSKKGVATPRDDVYITLKVPRRYQNNVYRYVQIVRNIAVGESVPERGERLRTLERMLHEPTSAAIAAIRLEAIGETAIPILKSGLKSPNREVNFYAAEALAHLDDAEAAPALALAAKTERAFRWHALAALSTMDHVSAYDALSELLDDTSAEARYGAFRSLRIRNPNDPLFKGQVLGREDREFVYHQITTNGEPMIHFSSTHSPEVVLFGMEQRMTPPAFVFAGKDIMLKGTADGRIRVIRFQVGQDEEERVVSTRLDHVIRAIAELGGSYTDLYQCVASAKVEGYISSRLVVNAKAHRNRQYHRDDEDGADGAEDSSETAHGPVPDMFADRLGEQQRRDGDHSDIDPMEKSGKRRGFVGRMLGGKDEEGDGE